MTKKELLNQTRNTRWNRLSWIGVSAVGIAFMYWALVIATR